MWRILARAKEPSSYAGLAAILFGAGEVFGIREAAPLAEAATQAGEMVASGGSPYLGIGALFAGVLAVVAPERGR